MDYRRNLKCDLLNHRASERISGRNRLSAPALLLALLVLLSLASCGGSTSSSSGGPVANPGGPYFTNVGQSITFNGTGSSAPSGQSLAYSWNFGDGATGTGPSPSHVYTISGTFTVALTVTDTAGASNMNTVAIQVFIEPVANPGGPYSGNVGQAIVFSGAGSQAPAGQSLGYTWNFGDGSPTASGVSPSHAYSSSGTYTVSLSVTDDTSGANSANTKAVISQGAGSGQPAEAAGNVTLLVLSSATSSPNRFAYVASSQSNDGITLSTDTVDTASGLLLPSAIPPLSLDTQFTLSGMTMDPSSKFLYLYGGTTILNFSADSVSGALTQQGSTIANGNLEGGNVLVFNPTGGFAFLASADSNKVDPTGADVVTVYSVDPNTGALTSVDTFSSQVQNPKAAAVDSSGKYLYVFGTEAGTPDGASQIAAFAINQQTGVLSPLPSSPFTAGSQVAAVAMAADPTGHFAYVAGSSASTGSATLSAFAMNAESGALSELPGSPFSAGGAASYAVSITLDPSGAFAYVLTASPSSETTAQLSVQAFSIDNVTGAPSLEGTQVVGTIVPNSSSQALAASIPSSVVPGSETGLATNGSPSTNSSAPRGSFLYVTNPADGSILIFSIDQATGAMSLVAPTPVSKNQ
jgi:PKD repeat protein